MKPTHLDLFSGIGGFSLAFEAEGFQTIGFSEIDPYASAVLKKHWPTVRNYGDIRNITDLGADVVTGGFPCQPFSVAGKRGGKEDNRHLWPEMLRVITECRSDWVLAENVPGIIGMELDTVLSDLETIGYTTGTFVIPACAVDARHRRDRVWIVANSSGEQCWTGRQSNGSGIEASNSGQALSDTDRRRREQRQPNQRGLPESYPNNYYRTEQPCTWLPEPELGRVAHGIPNRAHRLRCLGNAIVPQVAQIFAKAIMHAMTPDKIAKEIEKL